MHADEGSEVVELMDRTGEKIEGIGMLSAKGENVPVP